MDLPLRLLKFWFPNSVSTFWRIFTNTLLIIEEDLAVGLMIRLLFTPLFHDASIVGRVLSLLFRLSRILMGLLAYLLSTPLIIALALVWFLTPVLIFLPQLAPLPYSQIVFRVLALFGLALFLDRVRIYPKKRVRNIKGTNEVLKATKLKKKDLTWQKLIESVEVKIILEDLEIDNKFVPEQKLPLTNQILERSLKRAQSLGVKYITPGVFFVSFLESIPNIEELLMKFNLKLSDFDGALKFQEQKRNKWRMIFIWDEDFRVFHLKGTNRGWLSAPTPNLDSVSTDLTKLASSETVEDFIGREKVVEEVISLLSEKSLKNVLVVGEAGSGKSSLIHYLAKQIIAGNAPASLATKRLVSLDLDKLLSGVQTEGDLAEKIKNIFEEVKFIGDVILFVDEIQNLALGQAATNFNLLSLLRPHLESGQFQFIATTDQGSFEKILENNNSLMRLFNKVELPPASVEETLEIIKNRAIEMARYQKVKVTFRAINELIKLSNDYIHNRCLPDSAISILSQSESVASEKEGVITTSVIREVFSQRVNIPILELDGSHKEQLLNLETLIHQRMIDQEEAVSAIANTLRRSATNLREKHRPIGSFLFVGPTGVGKTELAKILAEVYFKEKEAYVRFDMSEYQGTESTERLIGGKDSPGELTEAVKSRPYSLILLDEFEKADPKVLTLFLQVLEDGRLTDSQGVLVDFTNTIIIVTSNAGSLIVSQELKRGLSLVEVKKYVNEELLKVFKPELINRFDDVVIFKPLSEEDLKKIVRLKLAELASNLKEQGYLISFDEGIISDLAQKGFDPSLGARPMRRLIQDTLESNLSKMILEGKLNKGQTFQATSNLLIQ